MNLKISGALIAATAAFWGTGANAALLLDPYFGATIGVGAATVFSHDAHRNNSTQSFGGVIGFDIPMFRLELEYDYMSPRDTRLHMGMINAYAKLPTTTIQPYIGGGIGTAFHGNLAGTDIDPATAYQAMLGLTFNIPVIPFKIDVEGRVIYLPDIYDTDHDQPDILQYDARVKLRYIF